MEHERFTDLLWAVLHLEEELEARTSLADLSPADEAHLEVDVRRAYNALLGGVAALRGAPQGRLPLPVLPGGAHAPVPRRAVAGRDPVA